MSDLLGKYSEDLFSGLGPGLEDLCVRTYKSIVLNKTTCGGGNERQKEIPVYKLLGVTCCVLRVKSVSGQTWTMIKTNVSTLCISLFPQDQRFLFCLVESLKV